jgi:N-sulfoglucosamine sulfohydrolase
MPITASIAADRSNILFIFMEDMGKQIPAYGDTTIETPQLDRLASQGVVFETAQVAAATCSSSRGSQYTGLYPHQNGIMGFINHHGFRFREGVPTYVQVLKQVGYECGLTYKTGVMPESAVPFDFKAGSSDNRLRNEKGNPAAANNGIDNFRYFLQNLEPGTPFYFQAQTPDTHSNWNKPQFIAEGSPGWPYPEVDPANIKAFPSFGGDFVLTEKLRNLMVSYYGAIQRTDWYVGQLLTLLEEFGLEDNTLVIFSADHGPSELGRGKTTPYELGLNVPFIARWPGVIDPGTRSKALVSLVDLFPTFQEVAGMEPSSYLPGYSLVPAFNGESTPREYLYSAYNAHTTGKSSYWPSRTVFDGRYKLIHNLNADGVTPRSPSISFQMRDAIEKQQPMSHAAAVAKRSNAPPEYELYDLKLDPGEILNLAGNPAYTMIEQEMLNRLWYWRSKVVLDPFVDPQYLAEFNADYAQAIVTMNEHINSLGGEKPSRTGWHLDWSRHIPAWDSSPYKLKD